MSEGWRRKTYYKPRVLIDVGRVLDPQFPDSVICLTGSELELLRNLTQYLHRRSTFADTYHDNHYLIADNDDWDSLQSIVASLEEKLMGCEEFLTLLEGILEQVTCACQQSTRLADVIDNLPFYGPSIQPVIDSYLDGGGVQVEDTYQGGTVLDAARCAVAQLAYWLAYEVTTEIFQPIGAEAVDILLPMAMVALAVLCGSSVLGIPIGLLLALLWSIIKIDVAGSLEDVENAILANERELTCALYLGLWGSYADASARACVVVNEMSGLSVLDKAALRLLFQPFMIALAKLAYTNNTAWAQQRIEAGKCDCCETTQGSNWYAVELNPNDNTLSGASPGCWQGYVDNGEEQVALVWRVQELSGENLLLKCMSAHEAGCVGLGTWPNTSAHKPNGVYFSYTKFKFNNGECKQELCPGATDLPEVVYHPDGPSDVNAGFHFTGTDRYVEIVFLYQVFMGTAPPCP